MNRFICTLLTTAFVAPITAYAIGSEGALDYAAGVSNHAKMPSVCDDVNLDDTQTAAIHDAYYNFAKQKNTLMAEVKNSMLDLHHTYGSMTSTKDDANNAYTAMKTAMGNLGDAVNTFTSGVFFDILRPEQRAPALACMEAMKHMKSKKNQPPQNPSKNH
ncbi:MAG TPA: hypothetical protein VN132_07210 [Bdellovibrio sp.]|nr:hypothetical protein [Bdellovibrio sp.]